jgi:hypothetical protein
MFCVLLVILYISQLTCCNGGMLSIAPLPKRPVLRIPEWPNRWCHISAVSCSFSVEASATDLFMLPQSWVLRFP